MALSSGHHLWLNLTIKEVNSETCMIRALQFWYQSQGYDVLKGNMEYETKDRWMTRLVSVNYHSMVRDLKP